MIKITFIFMLSFFLSGCSSFSAALPVFGAKFQEFNDGLIDTSRTAHAIAKTYTCETMRVKVLLESYPTQESMNAWAAFCLHSKPRPTIFLPEVN